VNYIKDLFKQIPARLLANIVWFLLITSASTISVFLTSVFHSVEFKFQYLVIAIAVFLPTSIISWLLLRHRKIESYSFKNTYLEYIINEDGTAIYNAHHEICPNMKICDRLVVKGEFEDLPGWSDPVINHDGNLLGSSVDKNYPCRYFIWLTKLPIPRQLYTYFITREYINTSEKPKPYISWIVKRKRHSMTFFVAIHKNLKFDKDNVVFIQSSKESIEILHPADEYDDNYSKCISNNGVQINSANYYIFDKIIEPKYGCKYSIEWKWDV